ncbi:hypothetical protein T11_4110 [Trichinella zimbabwensis]|uniref:Uncharacterized protein n=1 Tax=Trichinella zimbabwensis TaxID=268475 RepID=A0A0V1H5Z1_9BILA|nr:hypothetical protein T11_4110 [Trichinella zimbabwensis]
MRSNVGGRNQSKPPLSRLNCVTDGRAERHLQVDQEARSNLIGYAADWSTDTEEKQKSQQRDSAIVTKTEPPFVMSRVDSNNGKEQKAATHRWHVLQYEFYKLHWS